MNAHVHASALSAEPVAEAAASSPAPAALPQIPADIRISQPKIIGGVMASDIVMLLLTGGLAYLLAGPVDTSSLVSAGYILAITTGVILLHQRLYGYTIASLGSRSQQIGRFAAACAMAFGAAIAITVIVGADIGVFRPWLLLWAGAALAAATLLRVAMVRAIARWTEEGRLARRAVIVGGGKPVADLLASLSKDGSKAISILGLFDDRGGGERSPDQIEEHRKLGKFDELVVFCREHKVDLLIITLPHTAEARIMHLLKKLWVLPIDIRISAVGAKLKLRPRAYAYIGKVPFLAVFDKPLTDWGIAVKAVEDRLLAGIALLLLSPVMLMVALAVKLDSKGPVFFRQKRYGFNNDEIGVFKFRSMYVDQCDAGALKLVTKGDPRVTRVGAFIRKTSLDELPQLFNVLRGELSMVGPRPHAMQAKADGHIYDEVVEGYFARHKVKPGITGWAQINGWRGETDTVDKIERRVECDLQYIDNWSVFFDLYILAMTPMSLINTKNAY